MVSYSCAGPKVGIFLALIYLLFPSCAAMPTSADFDREVVEPEWKIAVDELAVFGVDARGVRPEDFLWRPVTGSFLCEGVEANGCYSSLQREISYNVNVPTVVRHEAGHAILQSLGYPCWREWQHTASPSCL